MLICANYTSQTFWILFSRYLLEKYTTISTKCCYEREVFFYCSYTDKPAWCKRRSVFWKHTQKTQLSEIKEDRTFDMCVQGLFFLSHVHRGRLYNIAFHCYYVFRGICKFHFGFKWRNFGPIFYSLNFQFINPAHDLPLNCDW